MHTSISNLILILEKITLIINDSIILIERERYFILIRLILDFEFIVVKFLELLR
jgi:hypothetical protein